LLPGAASQCNDHSPSDGRSPITPGKVVHAGLFTQGRITGGQMEAMLLAYHRAA
jgi:hypothetical protein